MLLPERLFYESKNKCVCGVIKCSLYGLCHCGCGEKTKISPYSRRDSQGQQAAIVGMPILFLPSHRVKAGMRPGWKRPEGIRPQKILDRLEDFKKTFHGKCHCGCGQDTEIASRTMMLDGEHVTVRGLPKRYIKGHAPNVQKGPANPNFKGEPKKVGGYIKVYHPQHPRADTQGYVYEHILVMEEKIGRPMKKKDLGEANCGDDEVVHHKDEVRSNNDPANLELMSHDDHMALHLRLRILKKAKRLLEKHGILIDSFPLMSDPKV